MIWISEEQLRRLIDERNTALRRLQEDRGEEVQPLPGDTDPGDERLRVFIDQAPVAIAMFDRQMRYISASRRWRTDYELGDRPLLGRCHYEVFPEIPERWKAAHRRGLAGKVVLGKEESFGRADGSVQWMHWEVQPWYGPRGEVGGIIIFTEDITERRQAEERLRGSEERYRTLADLSPDGILVNVGGRFVYSNMAAARLLGARSIDQILGRSPFDFLEPEFHASARERIAWVLEQKRMNALTDQVWKRLDGRCIDLEVAAGPVTWEGTPGVLVILRDITERKKVEKALRQSDQMKSEFITTTAHEFRTPLTSIQGYSELLMTREDLPAEQRREFLSYIHENAVELGRIVSDLLDISRIEKGLGLSLHLSDCTAGEIAAKLRPILQSMAPDRRIETTFLAEETPLSVDKGRIGQVMENILSNALKYSPEGSPVKICGKPTPEGYQIAISDQGIGMAPEQAARVFEKFYRADTSHASVEGVGIGMSIVKHIVDAHEGRVWIESEPGKGTTVAFILPRKPS